MQYVNVYCLYRLYVILGTSHFLHPHWARNTLNSRNTLDRSSRRRRWSGVALIAAERCFVETTQTTTLSHPWEFLKIRFKWRCALSIVINNCIADTFAQAFHVLRKKHTVLTFVLNCTSGSQLWELNVLYWCTILCTHTFLLFDNIRDFYNKVHCINLQKNFLWISEIAINFSSIYM